MVKKWWSVGSHVQWTFTWSISKKTSRPSPTVLGNNKLPFPSCVKKNHHTQIIHRIVKFALNGQEYRVRKRGYGPDRFGTARSRSSVGGVRWRRSFRLHLAVVKAKLPEKVLEPSASRRVCTPSAAARQSSGNVLCTSQIIWKQAALVAFTVCHTRGVY